MVDILKKHLKKIVWGIILSLRKIPFVSSLINPTNGYQPTIKDWIGNNNDNLGRLYYVHKSFDVFQKKPEILIPPEVTFDDVAFKNNKYRENETFVVTFLGGYVETEACEVLTPDRQLIGELLFDDEKIKDHLIRTYRLPWRSSCNKMYGKYATTFSYFSSNYAYWLLDSLPRLWVLEDSGLEFDWLILPKKLASFHWDLLELLGYPKERIKLLDSKCYQFQQLLVPSFPNHVWWRPNPRAVSWLRNRLLESVDPVCKNFPKRIYLSRSDDEKRHVLNQVDLLQMLESFGFEKIIPQNYSIKEQIQLFSQADIIVSQVGAGLANMLFLHENSAVIEIVGTKRRNPHFVNLASALNLRYAYVTNEGLPEEKERDDWNQDIVAPVDRVKKALEELGL